MDYIELNPQRRVLKPTAPNESSLKEELAVCKVIINHELKPYGLEALSQYNQICDRFIQLEVKFIQEKKRQGKEIEIKKNFDFPTNEQVRSEIHAIKLKLQNAKEANEKMLTRISQTNSKIQENSIYLSNMKEEECKLMHRISTLQTEDEANSSKEQSIKCCLSEEEVESIKLNNISVKERKHELCNIQKELTNKISEIKQKYKEMEISNKQLQEEFKIKDEESLKLVHKLSLEKLQINRLTIETQEQEAQKNKLVSALKEKQQKKEQMAGYSERSNVKQRLHLIYEEFNKENELICEELTKIEDLMVLEIEHASKIVEIK